MQIIHRQLYSEDAVNQMIMQTAASFGDESAEGGLSFSTGLKSHGQGEAEVTSATAPAKRLLSVHLLEYADDSTGDGDGEVADHDSPLYSQSKKRRLSSEQVRLLEMSFEEENKLEPERKVQLAKEVGLQPRQVAIWFQNRRARWKTKQLERDYSILKAAYDSLLSEKDKLQDEIALLHIKLETPPPENSPVIHRKDPPDYKLHQPNTDSDDLPLKAPVSSISLSDLLMLKHPTCKSEDQQDRQLHSPVSSNDASFDSNNSSFLTNTSEQRTPDLKVGGPWPVDMITFDKRSTGMLQSARLGGGDPSHSYLVVKQEPLGSVCNPQSYHQIGFKQEDGGLQEESYPTTFNFSMDHENGGWPWYWD